MAKTPLGFIGLGLMGRPMARRLLAEGYPLAAANRSGPAVDALAKEGATACANPAEAARRAEVIFTMLPDAPDVEAVVFGDNGLASAMRPGSALIDCTSNSPACAARVAKALGERGCEMLDAPVSGAPEGAEAGTLAIMAGGPRETFERCRAVLECLGEKVVHVGEAPGSGCVAKLANQILVGTTGAEAGTLAIMAGGPRETFERCRAVLECLGEKVVHVGEAPGSGCVAKLANQILVGTTFLGVGEALVFGAKAGLDTAALVDVLGAGLGRCGALEVKGPKILAGDFTPGGRVESHAKDLRYALDQAREMKMPLPATALVAQMFHALGAAGEGDLDHIAIIRVIERLAGAEARASNAESG